MFTRPGGRGAITLTPPAMRLSPGTPRPGGARDASTPTSAAIERGERQTLRIGAFQTATTELLPTRVADASREPPRRRGRRCRRSDAPTARPSTSSPTAGSTSRSSSTRSPDERIQSIPLLDDRWVILTRRDSDLVGVQSPSLRHARRASTSSPGRRRWRTQLQLEQAWRRRAISPRVVYRTDDNLALQRLVAAGYGHACLDRLSAASAIEPSLTWIEPAEILIPRTIALCLPRRRDLSGSR